MNDKIVEEMSIETLHHEKGFFHIDNLAPMTKVDIYSLSGIWYGIYNLSCVLNFVVDTNLGE